jgi:hypothetical protein
MRGVRPILATLLALVVAAPAHAAFPGQNGKIAFSRSNTIWTVTPDGSDRTQITTGGKDTAPRWSPDGMQIAFTSTRADPNPLTCTFCRREVYVMDADGSDMRRVTNTAPASGYSEGPSWSPDGTRLAFNRYNGHIWTINVDGTDEQRITPDHDPISWSQWQGTPIWSPDGTELAANGTSIYEDDERPISCVLSSSDARLKGCFDNAGGASHIADWSPDSHRLVFGTYYWDSLMGLYTWGPGGINELTHETFDDGNFGAAWSPDGRRIVFARSTVATQNGQDPLLHILDAADGSNLVQLSAGDAYERDPDWQPIPVNAYPRPKGASPTRVSLVPAYQPCSSPNRTHGPPLAFGSCNPPARVPGQLTIGTFDANGQPAKSVSYIRINPIRGNPATPADEADVRMRGVINDVRLASDLSDYTGNLEARLTIRITDKNNTPHPGGPGPATVEDFTHSQPLPCAATADDTVGSSCEFDTTVEALIPGAVKEQQRAIWQLDAVRVHDGAGNLFLTQGIFVP